MQQKLKLFSLSFYLLIVILLTGCHKKNFPSNTSLPGSGTVITQKGKASYYSDKFDGRKTANGEIFRQKEMTAAHKTLPFNTIVLVKNLSNGRIVQVRINDRGPFIAGRIIDLSKQAAKQLDMLSDGVVSVEISYRKK